MALGELTRQIAEQAIRSAATKPAPATVPAPDNVGAAIVGQVQAMQKALKEDEELVVSWHSGAESVRVMEFYVPSAQVVVLSGTDRDKNTTRVISPPESLQVVCKVMKVPAGAKPARINFLAPKPKPE
ncbi:MAG: hypothetical protein U0Q18_06140 [Bryobacteraceae bacterium]